MKRVIFAVISAFAAWGVIEWNSAFIVPAIIAALASLDFIVNDY